MRSTCYVDCVGHLRVARAINLIGATRYRALTFSPDLPTFDQDLHSGEKRGVPGIDGHAAAWAAETVLDTRNRPYHGECSPAGIFELNGLTTG
jgi:hypothetical protein